VKTNIAIFLVMSLSLSVLLRTRNISDKHCEENENIFFSVTSLFFSKIVPFMR